MVHSVVPIHDGAEIAGHGADLAAPFEAAAPEERFTLVSRKDAALCAHEWLRNPPVGRWLADLPGRHGL